MTEKDENRTISENYICPGVDGGQISFISRVHPSGRASLTVTIPKPLADKIGLSRGEPVYVTVARQGPAPAGASPPDGLSVRDMRILLWLSASKIAGEVSSVRDCGHLADLGLIRIVGEADGLGYTPAEITAEGLEALKTGLPSEGGEL